MICPKCGRDADGRFCKHCGAALSPEDSAEAPQEARRPVESPWIPKASPEPPATGSIPPFVPPGYSGAAPVSANGETAAQALYRRLASSPAFLIAALAFSLSAVLSLVQMAASLAGGTYLTLSQPVPPEAEHLLRALSWGFGALMLGLYALMSGAFWQIYCNAKGQGPLRTVGLRIHKVLLVIGLVLLCLLLLLGLIFSVLGAASGELEAAAREMGRSFLEQMERDGYAQKLPESFTADMLFAAMMVSLVATLGLLVLLAFKTLKTINTVKRVVDDGLPDDRISMLLLWLCVLGACSGALGLIRSLVGGVSLYEKSGILLLPTLLSYVLNAAVQASFALLLWRWREGMRALGVYRGVPASPAYPGAPTP